MKEIRTESFNSRPLYIMVAISQTILQMYFREWKVLYFD